MALSNHDTSRLKWLKVQLNGMKKSKARRELTIAKRIAKLNEPVKQIDADIAKVEGEIAALEAMIVPVSTAEELSLE